MGLQGKQYIQSSSFLLIRAFICSVLHSFVLSLPHVFNCKVGEMQLLESVII